MDNEAWNELLEFVMSRIIPYAESSCDHEEELGVMKVTHVGGKGDRQRLLYDPNVITYKQADMGSFFEYVWTVFYLGSIPSPFVHHSQPPRQPYVIYSNYSSSSLGLQHQVMRNDSSTIPSYQNTWNETQLSIISCPVFQYDSVWTPTMEDLKCLPYHYRTGRMLHTSLLSALESDHASSMDTYRSTWKPPTNNTGSGSNSSSSIDSSYFKAPNFASTPNKSGYDSSNPQKRCNFCKEMGYSVFFHSSHNQAFGGRVICPILRTLRCEVCGATGDNAHIHCNRKPKRQKNSQNKQA